MSGDALIRWVDVAKSFGPRTLFRELSGEASAGEVVAVLGRNGSGKSTFLKILAGLIRPTRGRVFRPFDSEGRPHLGVASPDLHLYPELSGAENLSFFGALLGRRMDSSEIRARMEAVGLGGVDDDLRVARYSTGMGQRLKIAFSLLASPPVLLLDEPGSNLDAEGRELVRSVVAKQRLVGTVIVATNDPEEAALGDRRIDLS